MYIHKNFTKSRLCSQPFPPPPHLPAPPPKKKQLEAPPHERYWLGICMGMESSHMVSISIVLSVPSGFMLMIWP